jgi:hypothetical protein
MQVESADYVQQPYICPACPKKYTSSKNFRNHLDNHHKNNESVECIISAKLQLESELNNHIYKFHCHYCNEKFSSHGTLDKHIKNSCSYTQMINFINKCDSKMLEHIILYTNNRLIAKNTSSTTATTTTSNITPLASTSSTSTNIINAPVNTIDNSNKTVNYIVNNNYHINNLNSLQFENSSYLADCFIKDSYNIQELVIEISKYNYDHFNVTIFDKNDYPFKEFMMLFEKVHVLLHCNAKHPENHNLHITNKKPHMPFKVFRNSWVDEKSLTLFKETVIEDIFDAIIDALKSIHKKEILDLYDAIQIINKIYYNHTKEIKTELSHKLFEITQSKSNITEETYLKTKDFKNDPPKNLIKQTDPEKIIIKRAYCLRSDYIIKNDNEPDEDYAIRCNKMKAIRPDIFQKNISLHSDNDNESHQSDYESYESS